ncbi:hypothetical protein PPERSA_00062 [Pseudocohnilembus persalinus]|uniref:Uncharacterized protein n=1 Tax=Pseudocohnilembus persalinus TaxID=266149 RepID=A0A0V0Q8T7_PSEPJ|nr:hypothetical protein PPERSA_00062 [Pseudocohnilembus persalinus]|eukprot:KRW98570.1 hypothetical protein PPERSA_00062 [Pseudocohnilembus persalinus]
MVLKDLKQKHSLEVAELLQINEQIKIEFQINLKNLQNKLQAKCNEYEKKQENFQELQKKVINLSRLVADKDKKEKEIMCTHQKFIDEVKNLDYDQIKEKKQKLLKNQQQQIENLEKFQCDQKQKKEAIIQQNQKNQLNKLQQQQRLELQNIDKILNEKEKQMLLIEKEKREKDEEEKKKKEQELLIKYKEQQKAQILKKEPNRQQIDKIEDFNKIDKNSFPITPLSVSKFQFKIILYKGGNAY